MKFILVLLFACTAQGCAVVECYVTLDRHNRPQATITIREEK